jgi:hypothetical protein
MVKAEMTRVLAQVSRRKQILRASVDSQISEVIRLADMVRVLRGNGCPVSVQVKRLNAGCFKLLEDVASEEQLSALENEMLGEDQ